MLLYRFQFLLFMLFTACGNKPPMVENHSKATPSGSEIKIDAIEIGMNFINSYVGNCNKLKESVGIVDWVKSNQLVTSQFKLELEKMIQEAQKADPELGLGFDPIFNAQDYPEEGFELDSFDSKTNKLVVRAKNVHEFKVTMCLVQENSEWLVDGCGVINNLPATDTKK